MNWLGRNTPMPSPPSTLFLALFTGGVPNDAGGGAIEVDVGNYARLSLSTGISGTGVGSIFSIGSPSNGTLLNNVTVTFPACSGADWGIITGWALFDAISGGNMLIRGDMTPSVDMTVGDTFSFLAVDWTIIMS